MDDRKIRRWAGGFGVGGFVVFLAALPLYFVGVGPGVPLDQTAQFGEFVARTSTYILIRTTLADALIMVGLLVFLAGFRHRIRQARAALMLAAAGSILGGTNVTGFYTASGIAPFVGQALTPCGAE